MITKNEMTKYSSMETSLPILLALEAYYDGRVYDHKSEAYAEWASPTEVDRVIALAWEIADDIAAEREMEEDGPLFWGEETLDRD